MAGTITMGRLPMFPDQRFTLEIRAFFVTFIREALDKGFVRQL